MSTGVCSIATHASQHFRPHVLQQVRTFERCINSENILEMSPIHQTINCSTTYFCKMYYMPDLESLSSAKAHSTNNNTVK